MHRCGSALLIIDQCALLFMDADTRDGDVGLVVALLLTYSVLAWQQVIFEDARHLWVLVYIPQLWNLF